MPFNVLQYPQQVGIVLLFEIIRLGMKYTGQGFEKDKWG